MSPHESPASGAGVAGAVATAIDACGVLEAAAAGEVQFNT